MASNPKSVGIASFGKRLVNQIWLANATRRATYSTLYEKNLDDQIQPSVVPDDVIQSAQSDKYWAPHPQTGVFGPAADNAAPPATMGGERSFHSAAKGNAGAGADSVLEEKAWFRPVSLEDMEKPNRQP